MARVVLAMSGGVDSSVAAHLLRAAGHDVIGVFMRHGEAVAAASCASTFADVADAGSAITSLGTANSGAASSTAASSAATSSTATSSTATSLGLPIVSARLGHKQGCCSASDAEDARRVADRLDIPFYAIDFQEDFRQIIDYFIDEYAAARTPNPCVMCNNWIKFGRLFDYADSVGAPFVATGHYARLLPAAEPGGWPCLARGVDDHKDQSYVLFGIERALLARMLLPVGEYQKDEIRAIAHQIGLNVADKRDSQEICFVPEGDHAAFIRGKRGASTSAGEIVTGDGRVVGRHDGLERFTIGQRKGLGIALGEPRFVVRLESDTHRVVLGTKDELLRSELTAQRANWLVDPPEVEQACTVKIRYNARPVAARVTVLGDDRLRVVFEEPQHAVAPGQAVVCYEGEQVLGGGWIE